MVFGEFPKKTAYLCDNLFDVENPNDPQVYPSANKLYRLMETRGNRQLLAYKDSHGKVYTMPVDASTTENSFVRVPADDDRLFGIIIADVNEPHKARIKDILDDSNILRWLNESYRETLYLTSRRKLERLGISEEDIRGNFILTYPDVFALPREAHNTTKPSEVIDEPIPKVISSSCVTTQNKQAFIEMFEKAQRFNKEQCELGQMLHKTLLNGGSVVSFGGELLDGYVKLLAEQSGISQGSIEWLLYEGGGRCFKDKVSYSVITAEDLWEFEKEVMNDNTPKM